MENFKFIEISTNQNKSYRLIRFLEAPCADSHILLQDQREVNGNETIITENKLKRISENVKIRERHQKLYELLTRREKQVIGLVVKGYNNLETAENLHISRATVEQHRKNIRKKLNYPTDFQLLRFAQAFNLDEI